jgi:hypothetical protein
LNNDAFDEETDLKLQKHRVEDAPNTNCKRLVLTLDGMDIEDLACPKA